MLAIRRMREEDIPQVAVLEKQTFSDAWSEKALTETLAQKQTILLTAFEDKKLIGYVILYYVLEEGEIARIAVSPEHRRQGVGARLLFELESLCVDNGISKLLLDVRESNAAAYAFYEEHGFVKDGIRKNFYTGPTEHAVLMSCEIGN
jgi:ribosomal-protein-alanine N-acetyltransferase